MSIKEKKLAAALAAVEMYLEQEAAALHGERPASPPPAVPGAWAEFGRADLMAGRRMMQMRAFPALR